MENLNTDLYEMCFVPDCHWDYLVKLAMKEDWSCKETKTKHKHPVLVNYITYTYERLAKLHIFEPTGEWIYQTPECICFNTGLLTKNYEWIYMLWKPSNNKKTPWVCKGFYKESDQEVCIIENLPRKAQYINHLEDLIFDTNAKIVPNFEHILEDSRNKERLPHDIKNSKNLLSILNGEIVRVKKRIDCNYKIAVPQYYDGKIQFLLPLSLSNHSENTDLVLVVDKISPRCYKGYTCLTLDMAYMNARQIAKPETEWLLRN